MADLIRTLVEYVNKRGTLQLDDDFGGARLTVCVKLPEGWNHCHIGSDNDPPTDEDLAALEAELICVLQRQIDAKGAANG